MPSCAHKIGRQLEDAGGCVRMIDHPGSEHREIAEPEGQSGEEADLGDVNDREAELRVDAVADGAARKRGRADVVADRIARETCERSHPIRHVTNPDGAQREEIVAGQCRVSGGDEEHRAGDIACGHRLHMRPYLRRIDAGENVHQHQDRHHDDYRAECEADPVPLEAGRERPGLVQKSKSQTSPPRRR